MLNSARADEQAEDLKQQVAALARVKSNLDRKLLAARELISQSTGLPVRSLPFAGELIDVIDPGGPGPPSAYSADWAARCWSPRNTPPMSLPRLTSLTWARG